MSMDDSSPRLEVGFVIDTGDSFGGLTQLQAAMDSTEAKVLADATRIERATRGMVDVSAATSNVVMFGNATSREMQTARQAMASAEKAGEALSRQLDRQASTFGKTREEIRAAKVETAALAAEQEKLTELAGRLRGQQQSLVNAEAAATDAAALARLRAMLDPAAAAQARLNSEIVEARRVMTAAGASAEELARAEGMLIDRANVATQTHGAMAGAAVKSGTALKSIAVQLPDITQGLLTGQKPMQVFIQQGAQILQVAQMGQG